MVTFHPCEAIENVHFDIKATVETLGWKFGDIH
jgi:hypothetical protein